MSKTTPGPYHIARGALNKSDGPVVCGDDGIMAIAMFLDFGIGPEQQEANARAWVEGRAAVATLEKIRAVEREYSESRMDAKKFVWEIVKILDEAKP